MTTPKKEAYFSIQSLFFPFRITVWADELPELRNNTHFFCGSFSFHFIHRVKHNLNILGNRQISYNFQLFLLIHTVRVYFIYVCTRVFWHMWKKSSPEVKHQLQVFYLAVIFLLRFAKKSFFCRIWRMNATYEWMRVFLAAIHSVQ